MGIKPYYSPAYYKYVILYRAMGMLHLVLTCKLAFTPGMEKYVLPIDCVVFDARDKP